jgi:sugar (pentulose or hexulose) kinase
VLEGVAFSLKDCLAIIREQGLQLEQIRATGGGASNSFWRQIIADILGVELVITNATKGHPSVQHCLQASQVGFMRLYSRHAMQQYVS